MNPARNSVVSLAPRSLKQKARPTCGRHRANQCCGISTAGGSNSSSAGGAGGVPAAGLLRNRQHDMHNSVTSAPYDTASPSYGCTLDSRQAAAGQTAAAARRCNPTAAVQPECGGGGCGNPPRWPPTPTAPLTTPSAAHLSILTAVRCVPDFKPSRPSPAAEAAAAAPAPTAAAPPAQAERSRLHSGSRGSAALPSLPSMSPLAAIAPRWPSDDQGLLQSHCEHVYEGCWLAIQALTRRSCRVLPPPQSAKPARSCSRQLEPSVR